MRAECQHFRYIGWAGTPLAFPSVELSERRKRARGPAVPIIDRPKERLTVLISGEVLNRLRNAVFWTPGVTMTGIVERCISDAIATLEKERGARFPQRSSELKAGRPPR